MSSEERVQVEQRLLESFLTLAHVDSPPRREGRIMQLLAPQLQALGLTVQFDHAHEAVGGQVGNLIATLRANKPSAASIFLSAHVDTVTSSAGIKTVVENGVIRTDGSTILGADDKAAVAAILEAVRFIVSFDIPHGPIQILFSICEEIGLKGAAAMDFDLVSARMGFVFDTGRPHGGFIIHAPSHDLLHATIRGKKAHAGAAPEQGVSAIHAAALGISRMKLGRIDIETTANIGTIHGGEATNVVPDCVEIEAEARSRNDAKLQAQIGHMTQCLEEGSAEVGGQADIKVSRHYSSFKLSEVDPVVQIACKAVRRAGLKPQARPGGGGSDANIFNARGIPSVVMSVGYENIHTNEEQISVADLVDTYRTAVALVQEAAERVQE